MSRSKNSTAKGSDESSTAPRSLWQKVNDWISVKYTVIFFLCMAALYIFSLFGGMLSSPAFTYAEF